MQFYICVSLGKIHASDVPLLKFIFKINSKKFIDDSLLYMLYISKYNIISRERRDARELKLFNFGCNNNNCSTK